MNRQKLWFKRKLYGWGWTPCSWEGWVIVGVFLLLIFWNSLALSSGSEPTELELIWFFAKLILIVALIIAICYKKGEKTRWQWGKRIED